ncbi:MAG: M23 family metallopeptidase [Leptospirales bacterium]|nr:M23 family metallopeptidase [Leptospirales bacterium]
MLTVLRLGCTVQPPSPEVPVAQVRILLDGGWVPLSDSGAFDFSALLGDDLPPFVFRFLGEPDFYLVGVNAFIADIWNYNLRLESAGAGTYRLAAPDGSQRLLLRIVDTETIAIISDQLAPGGSALPRGIRLRKISPAIREQLSHNVHIRAAADHRSISHLAVGLAVSEASPVGAVAAGVVVRAQNRGPYGGFVMIHHGDGLVSGYLPLSRIFVRSGDEVRPGTVVGVSGTSSHWPFIAGELEFAIWTNTPSPFNNPYHPQTEAIDPENFDWRTRTSAPVGQPALLGPERSNATGQ